MCLRGGSSKRCAISLSETLPSSMQSNAISPYRSTMSGMILGRRDGRIDDDGGVNGRPTVLSASVAADQLPLLTRNPRDFAELHSTLEIIPVAPAPSG